ncbi:MAG: PIN domain-containing protein [Caldilineaceae bacterium]
MNNLYIIDTHTLLWYLDADPRLGTTARQILHDPTIRALLPAIVLAEALFILERKPLLYKVTITDVLQRVASDLRITIIALDQTVVTKTLVCQAIQEMHDRQIVATALLAQANDVQVAVLTKDENIQNSSLVQTIW